MEWAFEVKWKTFFLVSQVLFFTIEKPTSKNVADTTFKTSVFTAYFEDVIFCYD